MMMRDTTTSTVEVKQEQGFTVETNCQEERIYVAIRVRPLNEKERTRQDVSEWECISHNTIKFKNNGHAEQRSPAMDTYTFDRVFGEKCSTQQVYEQAIKEVALSVVRGINSSIFAYGQTSSGKTYTMTGITEQAVRDIYEYIEKHNEREFVVKFSAMEIYNEAVRDLLNSNATSLRLLDDPEKGTIVEKLTEETLTERSQLQQLLSICAAERTTEETAMNETSSRSHQILRMTVESNPSNFAGTARSGTLVASVNFVDLAGSERASQALSAGTRLREGSHINRSLLTLGTVIRKLSKERNGHIPYRDSKLTRILHNSLGGNARTAIICTINPARSQVEQSKNTLFFAGCAKQVTTNARVNVLLSDKVLVKQLQKEMARMEDELRSLNTIILKERELQIEQMDKEIKELTRQRDLFQSHVENLLHSAGKDRLLRLDKDWVPESPSGAVSNDHSGSTDSSTSENLDRTTSSLSISNEQLSQQHENSDENFLLDGSPPTFVGPDPCKGWEEMTNRAETEQDNKTDINTAAIPAFEERQGDSPVINFVNVDAKSSSLGNGQRDQVAVQQKTQDSQRTNYPLAVADLSEKSNDGSSESRPHSLADTSPHSPPQIHTVVDREISSRPHSLADMSPISPPQIDTVDREISSHPRRSLADMSPISPPSRIDKVDREISSHPHSLAIMSPISPPQIDTVDRKISSHRRSLADMSPDSPFHPPQIDRVDRKISSHAQFSKVEQNVSVSPPQLNKLDEEPASPHQSEEEQELKTMSPPQLDEQEDQVSKLTSPPGVSFPEKLSERKLRVKKRKSSRKYPLVHGGMDASAHEDLESVMDSDEEDTASVLNFVVKMNQRTKPKSMDKDFGNNHMFSGVNKHTNKVKGVSFHGISGALIPSKFEGQQRDIIELWDSCNVPLVHRSYFFLLIKGELSDSVYLDVELRRLSFLKDAFSSGNYIPGEKTLDVTPNSSLMALTRERKMLSKQVHKKFSRKEREEHYVKWGIDLKTKHRSIQLAWLIWTNTKDMNHVKESAALVAKLVGFINTGESPKKTFGFGFFARRKSRKWQDTMSTL